MGKISKGTKCTVAGCNKEAIRSVSVESAKIVNLEVEGRRAYLCEEHYKVVKKSKKKENRILKWRYGL